MSIRFSSSSAWRGRSTAKRCGRRRRPCVRRAMPTCGRASGTRTEPAGADHRAASRRCRGGASTCRRWMRRRGQRLADILAQERAERFDLAVAPLLRFTLIRLAADRHRLVLTNHHILMDGWSMPVLVRELLDALCAARRYRRAAAADALPRLSGVDCGAGSRRAIAAWRAALGRAGRAHAGWPRTIRTGAGGARADHAVAERATLTAALTRAGAAAGSDAEHLDPGGVGDPAGAADRPRRRGVRGDGGGASAGDCRHREHGGAVHQHAAAARQAAAGPTAASSCFRAGAGQPVRPDGAPASRPGRDPGADGIGRAVRHPVRVRELSRSTAAALRRMPAGCGSAISAGAMPRTIR